jgi:hypothetical protein
MGIENKLDHYFSCGLNCLLRGEHGVGKTTLISECFTRNGLVVGETALIFSAATIDPWVDFIGVPKEITKDGKTYLDFIQPKHFYEDKVQAIFFDEFNRSHKKIRNAVLELIQFKSINGKKFKNLKVVWAAINPEDSEEHQYDVETLDPAQKDRFQILIDVPYKPDYSYFSKKFGEDWASSAIDWWRDLPSKIKKQISPRRLDYALEVFGFDGDLADVLPHESSPRRLSKILREGSPRQILSGLLNSNNDEPLKGFLEDTNNVEACIPEIIRYKRHMKRCLPLIRDESLVSSIFKNNKIKDHIEETIKDVGSYKNPNEFEGTKELSKYLRVLSDICKSGSDKAMSNWSNNVLSECIPGFMLLSGPKMTMDQMSKSILERYDIKKQEYQCSGKSGSYDGLSMSQDLNNIKAQIDKTNQTGERQHLISESAHVIKNNEDKVEHYNIILDILNSFCERSQKKTIHSDASLENVLYLSEWAIDSFSSSKEDIEDKDIKKLIRKIPYLFTKCLIGQIESNGSFSIFSLNKKARILDSLLK